MKGQAPGKKTIDKSPQKKLDHDSDQDEKS